QLIGINTAILAPGGGNIGIGFAVPIDMARKVMDELIHYGVVKRGRIGVTIQDLTPDLAQAMNTQHTVGAVIARVEAGSPADRGGLKSGDLVVAVDGSPVRSGTQLRNLIGLSPGLRVDRQGQGRAGGRDALPAAGALGVRWRKPPMRCSASPRPPAPTRSAKRTASSPSSCTRT